MATPSSKDLQVGRFSSRKIKPDQGRSSKDKDDLLRSSLASTRTIFFDQTSTRATSSNPAFQGEMILSFELPFALIPLLKFTSSKTKMGPNANSLPITVLTWLLGLAIMVINIQYLVTSFVKWLIHNKLPKVGVAFIGILGFAGMIAYLGGILYLAFRKDKEVTYLLPLEESIAIESNCTQGYNKDAELHGPFGAIPREDIVSMQLPRTRDLTDLD